MDEQATLCMMHGQLAAVKIMDHLQLLVAFRIGRVSPADRSWLLPSIVELLRMQTSNPVYRLSKFWCKAAHVGCCICKAVQGRVCKSSPSSCTCQLLQYGYNQPVQTQDGVRIGMPYGTAKPRMSINVRLTRFSMSQPGIRLLSHCAPELRLGQADFCTAS